MDADERRLITPYRAPTIAERKKWLFMAEDRQRPTRTFRYRHCSVAQLYCRCIVDSRVTDNKTKES